MAICWRRITITTSMPRHHNCVQQNMYYLFSNIILSIESIRRQFSIFFFIPMSHAIVVCKCSTDRPTGWLAVTGIKHQISRFMRKLPVTIAIEKLTEFYQSSNNELKHTFVSTWCVSSTCQVHWTCLHAFNLVQWLSKKGTFLFIEHSTKSSIFG